VAAFFYSVIGSAKLAGVEARAYLGEAARQATRNPGIVTVPGTSSSRNHSDVDRACPSVGRWRGLTIDRHRLGAVFKEAQADQRERGPGALRDTVDARDEPRPSLATPNCRKCLTRQPSAI
jgi:hypothetical protein